MADADLILLDAVRSVSLHLSAIGELANLLSTCTTDSGWSPRPYEFCLAFGLLAEAAQLRLDPVERFLQQYVPLKRDIDELAQVAS